MLWQIEQCATRSLTVMIASVRRSTCSRGLLRRWNARRCALLAPMPGRRWSSATSAWSESGRAIDQDAGTDAGSEPRQAQAAEESTHLLLHVLVHLAVRVGEG